MSVPSQGWYQDPEDPSRLRWWDGEDWTDHTHEAPSSEAEPQTADPRVDYFVVPEDLEPMPELDLDPADLQPDHVSPVVPEPGIEHAPVIRGSAATRLDLVKACLLSSLAALGAGLGSALVLGLALASGSPSHSVTNALLHAEEGIPITLVTVLLIVVALATACLHTLAWGLARHAGARIEARKLRLMVGISVFCAAILTSVAAVADMPGVIDALVGFVVLAAAQVLQLVRVL